MTKTNSSTMSMINQRDSIFWRLTHTATESTAEYGHEIHGLCETPVVAHCNRVLLLEIIELDRKIQDNLLRALAKERE